MPDDHGSSERYAGYLKYAAKKTHESPQAHIKWLEQHIKDREMFDPDFIVENRGLKRKVEQLEAEVQQLRLQIARLHAAEEPETKRAKCVRPSTPESPGPH